MGMLSVVTPAYNEEDRVASIVERVLDGWAAERMGS